MLILLGVSGQLTAASDSLVLTSDGQKLWLLHVRHTCGCQQSSPPLEIHLFVVDYWSWEEVDDSEKVQVGYHTIVIVMLSWIVKLWGLSVYNIDQKGKLIPKLGSVSQDKKRHWLSNKLGLIQTKGYNLRELLY